MTYIKRVSTKITKEAAQTFPAIIIIGPRQSRKTTFLKHEFGNTHKFVSLEEPDLRQRIK